MEPFAFGFCSDTHVGLASNLKENRAMFGEMAGQRPDFIVNGGDVTDYGWADEYANYRAIVDPLGAPLWKTAAPGDKFGYSSPIFLDGRLYAGTLGPQGAVRCADARTGETLWTRETGSDIYDSGPGLGDGSRSAASPGRSPP